MVRWPTGRRIRVRGTSFRSDTLAQGRNCAYSTFRIARFASAEHRFAVPSLERSLKAQVFPERDNRCDMTQIIFHLGPGKCGSSAIQAHLKHLATRPDSQVQAELLKAHDIKALEDDVPEVQRRFATLIARAVGQNTPLVISHEALFKKHRALLWLIRAAKTQGAQVSALAYVRRQSDFLRSVHAQWLFRLPDRIAETANLLRGHGIDPMLFTGAERHLLAVALGHMCVGRQAGGQAYFDWSQSMVQMAEMLSPLGVPLQVAALPARDAARPLIADFMDRIGVAPAHTPPQDRVVNAAFDPVVIEAVSNAIEQGYPMPGPHADNSFLAAGQIAFEANTMPDRSFQDLIGHRIDTQFQSRNQQFADHFDIDPAFFAPRQLCTDAALRAALQAETALRKRTPLWQRQAQVKARADAVYAAWQKHRAAKSV